MFRKLKLQTFQDLGYKNDVGYQTFLYHNETELRQVFMFLIEHLPSEGAKSSDTDLISNNKSLLLHNIGMKIAEELSTMWIPPCCNPQNEQSSSDWFPPTSKLIKETASLNNMPHGPPSYMALLYNYFFSEFLSDAVAESDIDEEGLIQELVKASLMNQQKQNVSTEGKAQNLCVKSEPQRNVINETLIELKENAIILRQKLNFLECERNIMDEQYQQVKTLLLTSTVVIIGFRVL